MVQYARMFFENRSYKSETDKRNERMNILNIEHISKNFGEKLIFDDVSYGIHEGDKIGIVGINGTGKTTFLKMIAGLEEPDNGQIIRQNGLRITYLPQSPEFPEGANVLDYVADGKWEQDWNTESEAKTVLTRLGITEYMAKIETLSGGQKKRVALARTLVNPADVLVLDEPTNHIDNEMAMWLEEYLNRFKGVLIMVTHDRYFLDRVTNTDTWRSIMEKCMAMRKIIPDFWS